MTDVPQGPDWFKATDGKWYPPPTNAPPPNVLPSPGQPVYIQQVGPPAAKNNAAKWIVGCVVVPIAAIFLLSIIAILAVTLLGKNASSKFSAVSSSISEVQVHTPTG